MPRDHYTIGKEFIGDLLRNTDPERALIAAIFRCAFQDLHATGPEGSDGWYLREDARRWFKQKGVITYWLTLAGLPASLYERLVVLAGVGKEQERPTPSTHGIVFSHEKEQQNGQH